MVESLSKPRTFDDRLREISMFFQKRGKEHQTLRRLVKRLDAAGIPYALAGAMAVNAHGAERTTTDVDIILREPDLERFRREFVGDGYENVAGRKRRFIDVKTGTTIDVLVAGWFPGGGAPGPIAFPDPIEGSEVRERVRVLTLPQLIQLKLAARRHRDFGDVVFLISVHNLDEEFLANLHPSVHGDFIECLEEKRREAEYIARQG